MSLTYKIAAGIVRLLGVKKMFLKSKEEMLEYARRENAKVVFDLDKAMNRASRKNIRIKLIKRRRSFMIKSMVKENHTRWIHLDPFF